MGVNIWILGMISLPWAKVEVFYFLIVCGAKRKGRRVKEGSLVVGLEFCWTF